MKDGPELFGQVAARERGRARVWAVTVTAGVAGLVTAGVVAYNLPAAHTKTVSGTHAANPAPSTSPTRVSYQGDDGEGGSASVSQPGSSGGSTSHATSGGS